jgi:hypothetical protein
LKKRNKKLLFVGWRGGTTDTAARSRAAALASGLLLT